MTDEETNQEIKRLDNLKLERIIKMGKSNETP